MSNPTQSQPAQPLPWDTGTPTPIGVELHNPKPDSAATESLSMSRWQPGAEARQLENIAIPPLAHRLLWRDGNHQPGEAR